MTILHNVHQKFHLRWQNILDHCQINCFTNDTIILTNKFFTKFIIKCMQNIVFFTAKEVLLHFLPFRMPKECFICSLQYMFKADYS